MTLWDTNQPFDVQNNKFDGYDYLNLQLTRVHADVLRQEIQLFYSSGFLPKARQADGSDANSRENERSTTNFENPPSSEEGRSNSGAAQNSASQAFSAAQYVVPDVPSLMASIQLLQCRRQDWETAYWRAPTCASSGDDCCPDHGRTSDTAGQHAATRTTTDADEQAMVGPYVLQEYAHLFESEFKSNRRLIFKFQSGDVSYSVRYRPTCVMDLFL